MRYTIYVHVDPHLFRSICGELDDRGPKCTHHAKQQKEDTHTIYQGHTYVILKNTNLPGNGEEKRQK